MKKLLLTSLFVLSTATFAEAIPPAELFNPSAEQLAAACQMGYEYGRAENPGNTYSNVLNSGSGLLVLNSVLARVYEACGHAARQERPRPSPEQLFPYVTIEIVGAFDEELAQARSWTAALELRDAENRVLGRIAPARQDTHRGTVCSLDTCRPIGSSTYLFVPENFSAEHRALIAQARTVFVVVNRGQGEELFRVSR